MTEATGGGTGWIDFDRDGRWDLYLVQGGEHTLKPGEQRPPNRLFRNSPGDQFLDITAAAGIGETGYGQGLCVGDFDNDGFDDIYVTNVGSNVLYRNMGDGTFDDVTKTASVDTPKWSTSAAWADLDQDGDLDLFVCNYLDYDPLNPVRCPDKNGKPALCHPEHLNGVPNSVFLNKGDGTFRLADSVTGLYGTAKWSKSLGVAIADFNDDGRPDIYVSNDTTVNFFFVNQGEGKFTEMGRERGCAANNLGLLQASMGIALGDYDGNGFCDLYVTHFTDESNTLYANLGKNGFQDVTRRSGLHQPALRFLGFGTVMADFNQNGRQDLVVANGHIDDWRDRGQPFEMKPQLFSYVSPQWVESSQTAGPYFDKKFIGRAIASADYDRDGDYDLAIVHHNAPMALLRNESKRGKWLSVELIGRFSNRRGIGAKITVVQEDRKQVYHLAGGTSYCASHQPVAIFGFGDSSEPVSVNVRWPNGIVQKRDMVEVNQKLVLTEPSVSANKR